MGAFIPPNTVHGLYYAPQGLYYAPQGLHYAPQGLYYAPQGLYYAPQIQNVRIMPHRGCIMLHRGCIMLHKGAVLCPNGLALCPTGAVLCPTGAVLDIFVFLQVWGRRSNLPPSILAPHSQISCRNASATAPNTEKRSTEHRAWPLSYPFNLPVSYTHLTLPTKA